MALLSFSDLLRIAGIRVWYGAEWHSLGCVATLAMQELRSRYVLAAMAAASCPRGFPFLC